MMDRTALWHQWYHDVMLFMISWCDDIMMEWYKWYRDGMISWFNDIMMKSYDINDMIIMISWCNDINDIDVMI